MRQHGHFAVPFGPLGRTAPHRHLQRERCVEFAIAGQGRRPQSKFPPLMPRALPRDPDLVAKPCFAESVVLVNVIARGGGSDVPCALSLRLSW
jgi:hypothetical protein